MTVAALRRLQAQVERFVWREFGRFLRPRRPQLRERPLAVERRGRRQRGRR